MSYNHTRLDPGQLILLTKSACALFNSAKNKMITFELGKVIPRGPTLIVASMRFLPEDAESQGLLLFVVTEKYAGFMLAPTFFEDDFREEQ